MKDRLPLIAAFAVLGFSIALGSVLIADGIRDRNRNEAITVTGSAKQRITSDYAVWYSSIASEGASVQAALPDLNRWSRSMRRFLADHGALAAEVSESAVTTETLTDDDGRVTGYKLSRSFEVHSPRVGAVTDLVHASESLLADGVPLQAQPVQYSYTKLADLRPALLAAATKDALGRAKVLVEATGGSLGGLRDVNVGVFQVTAPNSTEVSDYGVYDTSTVRKDVTAVVNVTFALK